jgi:Xaa-Pro aminopeptidase
MPIEAARAVHGGSAPRQHGAMEYSTAPVDLDTVRRYRLGRLRAELKRRDYAGLLLFDQINTRYATDATNMQIWCSHYETRCVFVATEGPVVLFDYAKLPHLAEDLPTVDDYRALPSFYYFAAGPRAEEKAQVFGAQIADLVREHGGCNRRLAVDRLSHLGVDALRAQGLEVMAGEAVAEDARAVKSAEELELMRASISVCEAGMDAMRAVLEPGITENALWARLHETNIRLGGEWIETRLLSSGPRTNPLNSAGSTPPPTPRSSTTSPSSSPACRSARSPRPPGRSRRNSCPTVTAA